jgi:hypothetical protein
MSEITAAVARRRDILAPTVGPAAHLRTTPETRPDDLWTTIDEAVTAGIPEVLLHVPIVAPRADPEGIADVMAFLEALLRRAPGTVDILTGFSPDPTRPADQALQDDPEPHLAAEEWTALIRFRQELERRLDQLRRGFLEQDLVPEAVLRARYRNVTRHGFSAVGFAGLIRQKPWLEGYLRLLESGEALPFGDIPPDTLDRLRPLRTWDIRKGLDVTDGFPVLLGQVLSPLEFEFLLRCSGKLRWREVAVELGRLFVGCWADPREMADTLIQLAETFVRRRWIVFCPW